MRVTISCRYCIAFEVMLLFLVVSAAAAAAVLLPSSSPLLSVTVIVVVCFASKYPVSKKKTRQLILDHNFGN